MTRAAKLIRPVRQRGAAVIGALIIVAIVAALSSSLFLRQTATARQVENEQARVQARWLLLGGIDWARLMLRDHGRNDATTRLDQVWATPVMDTRIDQPGEDRAAMFSGSIEDEQGKFNLYTVAVGGVVSDAPMQALRRLADNLGLPGSLAPRLAGLVALAQPPAPAAPAEGQPADEAAPAPPAKAPLPRGVDDLAALAGVDDATRAAMRRTMTLLPAATTVNVNTAPPEVLAALVPGLSLGQARSMAGDRDRGRWFLNTGDFANRLAGAGVEGPPPTVAVTSAWYLATGTVAYDRARVTLQALLLMNSSGGAPRTVWTREVQ